MPISSSDLKYRYSGGASNTSAAASLGGAMSTVAGGVITDNTANNLWDDVSSSEASAGDTEYRGLYFKNEHGSLQLQSPVVWISSLTSSSSTEFDIAMAAEAIDTTMATIANESTTPATVTFSRPTTKGAGLAFGSLNAGSYRGFWIRRTVTAGAAGASDTGAVRVEGDTAP